MADANIIKSLFKKKSIIRKAIVIFILVLILLSVFFYAVSDEIMSKTSKMFSDVVGNVSISGNNLKIDDEYYKEAIKRLKDMGIDAQNIGLGRKRRLFKKILRSRNSYKLSLFRRRRITGNSIF